MKLFYNLEIKYNSYTGFEIFRLKGIVFMGYLLRYDNITMLFGQRRKSASEKI